MLTKHRATRAAAARCLPARESGNDSVTYARKTKKLTPSTSTNLLSLCIRM